MIRLMAILFGLVLLFTSAGSLCLSGPQVYAKDNSPELSVDAEDNSPELSVNAEDNSPEISVNEEDNSPEISVNEENVSSESSIDAESDLLPSPENTENGSLVPEGNDNTETGENAAENLKSNESNNEDSPDQGIQQDAPESAPSAEKIQELGTADDAEEVPLLANKNPGNKPVKSHNVTNGSVTITDSSYYHEVSGSTTSHEIKIQGGTAGKPIEVNLLSGLRINMHNGSYDNATMLPAIQITSSSYVNLYICEGDPNGSVYLTGGCDHGFGSGKNDGYPAISIESNAHVLISGDGFLEAYGGAEEYGAAAIGTAYDTDLTGGSLTIDGNMSIKAYGAHSAPGIGTGRNGNLEEPLTIKNGTIRAYGGAGSTAIGVGEGGDIKNKLIITGGTITAYGAEGGSGIGMSEDGKFYRDEGGLILINGGTITAKGGSDGAGIGGGNSSGGDICLEIDQESGNLNINATGGENAAGIGGGNGDMKSISIELNGGTINAQGGKTGAGIGSGDEVESIKIKGTGTITAIGGDMGCGIGGGSDSCVSGHLTIEGGGPFTVGNKDTAGTHCLNITASASNGKNDLDNEAAAIGSGKGTNCDISIKNADLTTHAGGQGADIGGGAFHIMYGGTVDTITIDNCNITSTSTKKVTSGIGSGYGACVNNIYIRHTHYSGGGIGASLMDQNYLGLNSVKKIEIEDSDVSAYWNESDPGHCTNSMNFVATDLEHGAAGIGSGQYGSMDSITIKNSKVYAHGFGSGAGIGTGGRGAYTLWVGLDKLDIGDLRSISIEGSEVTAYSGFADFSEGTPTTIGEITVDPMDVGSGAGIGSGCGSECGTIYLKNCPKIYAKGFSGAGIGAGNGSGATVAGSVDSIKIENCDDVFADGGRYCAGIGTSSSDGLRGPNTSVLKAIEIWNCAKVYAEGGSDAAGIGCGLSSPYETGHTQSGYTIDIYNSNVTAKGGSNGAGIGAGYEHGLGYGGDCPTTQIRGKCCVEAYGGKRAAGIGGGYLGGAEMIVIDLEENKNDLAKGTFDNPAPSGYYVKAAGGTGAAGIGGGGDNYISGEFTKNDSTDVGKILIKGGAVFAKGGDTYGAGTYDGYGNWYSTGDFKLGAGAGIGGSAGASHANLIEIDHGFVWAKAGKNSNDSDRACDIGTGGDYSKADLSDKDLSEKLIINDGTVLSEKMDRFKSVIIKGGSVRAVIPNAVRANGTKVYRTSVKLADSPQTKVGLSGMQSGYAGGSVYTDENQRLFFYLDPKGSASDRSQTADIKAADETRHYMGYTDKANTGIMKMERGEIGGRTIDSLIKVGIEFFVAINDDEIEEGAEWTDFQVTKDIATITTIDKATSPGAKLHLHADKSGEFTVTAKCKDNPDASEMFWETNFKFTGNVGKVPKITLENDLNKTYDGLPAAQPVLSTDSDGAITFNYCYSDGRPVSDYSDGYYKNVAPVSAGHYRLDVFTAETETYQQGKANFPFEIAPITPTITQTKEGQTIIADVSGLMSEEGDVQFTAKRQSDGKTLEEKIAVTKTESGTYQASWTPDPDLLFPGLYDVSVQYLCYNPGHCNYANSEVNTVTYEILDDGNLTDNGIEITPDGGCIYTNFTLQLTATLTGDATEGKTISWYSSNEKIATVDQNGLVLGLSEGEVWIAATTDDQSAFDMVAVQVDTPKTLEITPDGGLLDLDETLQLSALVNSKDPGDLTILWSSENDSIVSVDENGLVTAHKSGSVSVSAAVESAPECTDSVLITVSDPLDQDDDGSYIIRTYQDLVTTAKRVHEKPDHYAGASYILANNIKAPDDSVWTEGIGSYTDNIPFTGRFDGCGYCIIGMNINMPDHGGLFELIGEGGTVTNLFLFDCDFIAPSAVAGGIAAVNKGTISYTVSGANLTTGVYVSPNGSLISLKELNSDIQGNRIGGIAGENSGTVFASRSAAEIHTVSENAIGGGLVAYNDSKGTISNCAGNNYVYGQYEGAGENIGLGGMCGENQGMIKAGYSSAFLSAGDGIYSGSLAGYAAGKYDNTYYCCSEGMDFGGKIKGPYLSGVIDLSRGEMMTDSFVNDLMDRMKNEVSWVRSNGLNAGLPRIENPSTAFADEYLKSGNSAVSGTLHQSAVASVNQIEEGSEAWNLLASSVKNGTPLSAYSSSVQDKDGNIIPAELWSQTELVYSVLVGSGKTAKETPVIRSASMFSLEPQESAAALSANASGSSRGIGAVILLQDGSMIDANNLKLQKTPEGTFASFSSEAAAAFMLYEKPVSEIVAPKTGDINHVLPYILILAASAGVIITVGIALRRRKRYTK